MNECVTIDHILIYFITYTNSAALSFTPCMTGQLLHFIFHFFHFPLVLVVHSAPALATFSFNAVFAPVSDYYFRTIYFDTLTSARLYVRKFLVHINIVYSI